jgi:hypothetical protein
MKITQCAGNPNKPFRRSFFSKKNFESVGVVIKTKNAYNGYQKRLPDNNKLSDLDVYVDYKAVLN